MNLQDGFVTDAHARMRMRRRAVTAEQILCALADYHTSYPAEPQPRVRYRCTVYQATIDGRQLKVYVQDGTHPPLVRSVAWKDA